MKIFCVSVVLLGSLGNLFAEERWWDVLESRESPFGGGHVDGDVTDKMKSVLEKKAFEEWIQYEDEYVKFKYPKDDLIKLEVNKPENGLKVEGGVCTTVDNGFTQAYVLRVGEASYGVFLLSPKEWLDDGICMCGPMVHHAYKINDGTLTRFSLLPSGAVKKAQVIGGGLRMMSFEWTHLACPREVYEKMVASMSIKTKQKGGDAELREMLINKYGEEAKLGLIQKSGDPGELVSAFGEPSKDKDSGIWSWAWKGEDYPCSLSVKVKDGKVDKFVGTGIQYDSDNPIRGSLAWCERVLEERDKGAEISEDEKDLLKKSITKNLTKYEGGASPRWFSVVDAADEYCEQFKECPNGWVESVMTARDGEWYTIDFVESNGGEKFAPWIWSVWEHVMKTDSLRGSKSYEQLHDLGEKVGATNKEKLQKSAGDYWSSGDVATKIALFSAVDSLESKMVEQWVIETLNMPFERKTAGVTYAAMEAIPSLEVEDKGYLLKLVDKIPAGRENSEWSDCRRFAIEHLGGKVEEE